MTNYEKGFSEGKQVGFTTGFSAGFWSAVLLVSGMVVAGLLVMRATGM